MNYKSYSKDVEKALDKAAYKALYAIGLDLVRFGSLIITANGNIDTGRLRASITAIVESDPIENDRYKSQQNPDDVPNGNAGKKTLQYGTNVEYGWKIEKRFPFLKPAFLMNKEVFQKHLDNIYQEVLNEHK